MWEWLNKNWSGKQNFFYSPQKNWFWGTIFYQECLQKSNLHSPTVWEWLDKNWSGQKAKTPKKHGFFQALNRKKKAKKGKSLSVKKKLLKSRVLGGGLPSGLFNFYQITLKPAGECRLDFPPPNKISFIASKKKVRSQQWKAIGQWPKFLSQMCSSYQDCYVHQIFRWSCWC